VEVLFLSGTENNFDVATFRDNLAAYLAIPVTAIINLRKYNCHPNPVTADFNFCVRFYLNSTMAKIADPLLAQAKENRLSIGAFAIENGIREQVLSTWFLGLIVVIIIVCIGILVLIGLGIVLSQAEKRIKMREAVMMREMEQPNDALFERNHFVTE